MMAFVDTNLIPFTVYSYTVQAGTGVGGALLSDPSGEVTVRTAGAPPGQLRAPRCNASTASTVTVEWDPPDEPNGVLEAYVLFVNGTRQWQLGINGQELQHIVVGLDAFASFSFTVVAASAFGASPPSDAVVCRTDIGVPEPLAQPNVTLFASNTSTAVNVTWLASADLFPVDG